MLSTKLFFPKTKHQNYTTMTTTTERKKKKCYLAPKMKQKKFRFLGNALRDEVVKRGKGVGSKCIGVNSKGYTWP